MPKKACCAALLAVIIVSHSLMSGDAQAEAGQKASEGDPTPYYFTVKSKAGNDVIAAHCEPKRQSVITCEFAHVTIISPDLAAAEKERKENDQLVAQLGGVAKFNQEMAKEARLPAGPPWFSNNPKAFAEPLAERAKDPSVGPKTRKLLTDMARLALNKDTKGLMDLTADTARRTCDVYAYHESLDFKKVGPRKWLSNPGPQGACRAVIIDQLESEEGGVGLWTLTERKITVGRTDIETCKKLAAIDYPSEEVWSWKNVEAFELPCDFIEMDRVFPPDAPVYLKP